MRPPRGFGDDFTIDQTKPGEVPGGELEGFGRAFALSGSPSRGSPRHPSGEITEYTEFSNIITRSAEHPGRECALPILLRQSQLK